MTIKPWQKIMLLTLVLLLFAALGLTVVRQLVDLGKDLADQLYFLLPGMLVILVVAGGIIWLFSRKETEKTAKKIDRESVRDDIERAEKMGIDMTEVRRSLEEIERRRTTQRAVFSGFRIGQHRKIQPCSGANWAGRHSQCSGFGHNHRSGTL